MNRSYQANTNFVIFSWNKPMFGTPDAFTEYKRGMLELQCTKTMINPRSFPTEDFSAEPAVEVVTPSVCACKNNTKLSFCVHKNSGLAR